MKSTNPPTYVNSALFEVLNRLLTSPVTLNIVSMILGSPSSTGTVIKIGLSNRSIISAMVVFCMEYGLTAISSLKSEYSSLISVSLVTVGKMFVTILLFFVIMMVKGQWIK